MVYKSYKLSINWLKDIVYYIQIANKGSRAVKEVVWSINAQILLLKLITERNLKVYAVAIILNNTNTVIQHILQHNTQKQYMRSYGS